MVRVRRGKPIIPSGRNQVREEDMVLSQERRASLFPDEGPIPFEDAVRIVAWARKEGLSIEEIQQGTAGDQAS